MLYTLLMTRGERQRRYHLGVGVDLNHPLHEAIGILIPPIIIPQTPQPSSGASGWLLHLSSRNVIVTSIAPLEDAGRVIGFRARLLESAGRPANLAITAFRPVTSAKTVDFLGNTLAELKIDEGKIKLDLSAHEWTELLARW
jgi:alpha-mannosidase